MSATVTPERLAEILPADCRLAFGANADRLCWWCGGPVPALRLEFCSQACEAAVEEAHVWGRARPAALRRAAHRCSVHGCVARRGVHVHHVVPAPLQDPYGPGCQHHGDNLAVRCPAHHDAEHRDLRAKRPVQMPLFRAA